MTVARTYALVVGWLLTAAGIIGFALAGETLFGVFEVNGLHNAVHLITGVGALFFGYYSAGAHSRAFDQWLGGIYLVVAAVGFAIAGLASASILGILPVNLADNVLHLAIAVSALAAGFTGRPQKQAEEEPALRRVA